MVGFKAAGALFLTGVATATIAGPARAQATEDLRTDGVRRELEVRRIVLDNGMRVLALPRLGAPVVSLVVRFAVGGVNERPGTTGAAHFLEHLLFRGTEKTGTEDWEAERALYPLMDAAHDSVVAARVRGDGAEMERLLARISALEDSARVFTDPGEFDRILRRAGARGLNATTSNDATTYFVDLPSHRLREWFELEADRMANPVLRGFYSERKVVIEERKLRVEGDPGGALVEAHLAAAFSVHPYRHPVVGYMTDLENLSREEVAAYHRSYYGARNAVTVIVGDVDPDEIEALARRHFGPLPAGDPPPPITAKEPEQRGERRVELVFDVEPRLRIGWKVPAATHHDTPALELLATLLTGGRSSRLHRRLILEDRIAASVSASLQPGSAFPRLLVLDAIPLGPTTTAQVEEAVYEEVERLASEGPTEVELARVRNQVRAGTVRGLVSNFGLALRLAENEALFGDWRAMLGHPERLRAVTADEVRHVARKYLVREGRTVATVVRGEGPIS